MGFDHLSNCPVCGQLFIRGVRSVCAACYKKVEEDFEKVYKFIRNKENRESTIPEVSEATGVTEKQILQFVREGRIRAADYPNIGYPCESCGVNMIKEGKLCEDCKRYIDNEIRISLDDEYRRQQLLKKKQGRAGFLNKN